MKPIKLVFAFALWVCTAIVLISCAALQKAEPYLPTASEYECILTGIEGQKPALTIVQECNLVDDALPIIENLLVAKRMQSVHRASDAGSSDAAKE